MSLFHDLARRGVHAAVQVDNSMPVAVVKAWGARMASSLIPSRYWDGKYPHTFLERQPPAGAMVDGEVPNVIWTFWTGDNELTPARQAGLDSMRSLNPDTPLELVTPQRLDEFILEEWPLHAGYDCLSLNHRSDYLRAYFLYHYGGGYADIKTLKHPWREGLQRLQGSPGKWLAGTALTDPKWAGNPSGRLGKHVRRYYRQVLSGGTLASRQRNPLLGEWLQEAERVLDYALPAMREAPGGTWGQQPGYPLDWMALQGNILQPLTLKYQDHISVDPTFAWDESVQYR